MHDCATFSVPVSWLGIIGLLVPPVSLAFACWVKARDPARYATMGRFVNESA